MARQGSRGASDKTAVHRVHGGSAPAPLAKTRSGRSTTPPVGPVTVRLADGTTKVVPAKSFRKAKASTEPKRAQGGKRKNRAGRVGDEEQYRDLLKLYRASGKAGDLKRLRAVAERLSWQSRLDAALMRMSRNEPPPASWR